MPTDNNINGKAFLKLRGSDLLDLFPDNFLIRKEVSDFLDDLVREILTSAFYSKFAFSVQFSASYLQAQSCIAAVCFVKILSFFHLPENRALVANTITIGFTAGTCCCVLYKFCNSCTCTSLKILVDESLQRLPKKVYNTSTTEGKRIEMPIAFIYIVLKRPLWGSNILAYH